VNVLRDTHKALVPGGLLVDFHPVAPPWPRVISRGEELGELRYEPFLDDLTATEGGMREVVGRGLFERIAARTHDIATHFDDPNELLDEWLTEDEEEWASPELEARIRSSTAPVDVVDRLVFNLYRSEPLAPTS
jgi:hypothetical protein